MKTFFFLVCLTIASGLTATPLPDNALQLTGTVAADGAPIEYATVSAYGADSSLVNGTVTDEAGRFSLPLKRGQYRILIEFIGFSSINQIVDLDKSMDLGTIQLGDAGVDLEAVEVTAEKSRVNLSLDKKVFNLGQDILARSGSANQVLEQLPSVTVSVDGVVSLRGNAGVRILINGRPSAVADNNALESIPAESIERVEIITNPSARYEAAGTAGIINIILKANRDRGYGGTVSLSTGYPADHRTNLNLNLRRPNWSAFFTGGLRYSNYRGIFDLDRTSNLPGTLPLLDSDTDQDRNDVAGNFFTGIDYQLSDQTTLTANYSLYSMINDDEAYTDYIFRDRDGGLLEEQTQFMDYREPGDYHQLDFTLVQNYPETEGKLTVYLKNDLWIEEESEAVQVDEAFPATMNLIDYLTSTKESSRDHLLQADYESPLGSAGKIELGVRGETRVISADYQATQLDNGSYQPIPGFSNEFDYFERIASAYGQYALESGPLGIQLGMRGEYTFIRTENSSAELATIEKDYLRLFPSASLSYRWNDGVSAQISYGRRIRRPAFWQLNPFAGLRDPNQLFVGNPDIDPAFTDRVEINFLRRWEKLTLNPAIYASRTLDFFAEYVEQTADNLFDLDAGTVLSRPINLDEEYRYGVEMSADYRPADKFSVSGEVNVFGYQQSGIFLDRDYDYDYLSWSGRIRVSVELPAEVDFQGSLFYQAPFQDVQSTTLSFISPDFGLSKQWGESFTLSANVRGPRYRNIDFSIADFSQTNRMRWTGWRFSLTGTYRFEKGAGSEGRRQRGSIR